MPSVSVPNLRPNTVENNCSKVKNNGDWERPEIIPSTGTDICPLTLFDILTCPLTANPAGCIAFLI